MSWSWGRTLVRPEASLLQAGRESTAFLVVRQLTLFPERRPRLLQPAAEPYRGDAAREPARIVGFDRERAQRGGAHRRLKAGARNFAQEAGQRLVLVHAYDRIVIAGHADVGHESGAVRQHLVVG